MEDIKDDNFKQVQSYMNGEHTYGIPNKDRISQNIRANLNSK